MKGKKLLCLLLTLTLALGLAAPAAAEGGPSLRLAVPENWELEVGDSRTLDYVFSMDVTERMLLWTSSDEEVATVDAWGRVTAHAPGEAEITATQKLASGTPLHASALLQVVPAGASTKGALQSHIVNYGGEAVAEVENLQKLVSRWSREAALDDETVPEAVKALIRGETEGRAPVVTADGAQWEITDYGLLRRDENAPTARDREMRFMGDRYFYEKDTTDGKLLAILEDGANGVWAVMATGVTHIELVEMSAAEKASIMSNTTQDFVSRRGMVSEANWNGTDWVPRETDNDGLWTAMYGAGELFRYAALRDALAQNPYNTVLQDMTDEARESAKLSTEAVLLLANISMRTGTTEAYVRYIGDGGYDLYGSLAVYNEEGKGISDTALLAGGDYSLSLPDFSPAANFQMNVVRPIVDAAWANPVAVPGADYASRTRLLEGFIARTYSLHGEDGGEADSYGGKIYYDLEDYSADNRQAVGKSRSEGVVNNEDLRGISVDASGEIPARLWNDLLGAGVEISDIVYKGDTSTDEIIGHLFIYKIAYDVFRYEDPELAGIIADTMENFAQHLSDNEYMLVDASGQPTTWGKLNRAYFYTYRWGAPSSPLTAAVLLTTFKVAAYVTGNQKWEDEYRLLLEDGAYLYGDIMTMHTVRDEEFLDKYAAPLLGDTLQGATLTQYLSGSGLSAELSFLLRMFAQYSDEEMAMLAFYTLFQLETDEATLALYRTALDEWWNESMQYSENPLWYYIYQLAYPNETEITDAYGNNILETAAWSLSRHPIDTRRWAASNTARDDLMLFNLEDYDAALATRGGLSIKTTSLPPTMLGAEGIIGVLLTGGITQQHIDLRPIGVDYVQDWHIEYAVAAPDERSMHKYNASSYRLDADYNPNQMEGSTTYTLPYWMGVYHGMLALSDFDYVAPPYTPPVTPPVTPPEEEPTPASELFDDVAAGAWYHEAVTYVVDQALFDGIGPRTFQPDGIMTRGMTATVLWRLAGKPAASGETPFTDVDADGWYGEAVAWAYGAGIINGLSETLFAPESPVSREQLVTMLWRYAKSAGMDVSIGEDTNILSYPDAEEISDYAVAAFQWACGAGVIEGRDNGSLAPRENVKRCETAKILMHFDQLS